MRFVIQRVSHAKVTIGGEVHGSIDGGYMVLIGIEESDNSNIKKEQELEDLKQEEEEIDDSRSVLSIDDTFFRNETEKINERFNKEKKRIDEKHKFKKPKLEIDECDKEKMQNHKKQIKKLKKYSKNLNYDKVIDNFSLKEYV